MEEEQSLEDAILRMGYFGAGLVVGICDAQNIPLPKENLHALVLAGPALLHGTLSGLSGLFSGGVSGYIYGKYYGRVIPTEKNEVLGPEEFEQGKKEKMNTVAPFTTQERAWIMVKHTFWRGILSAGFGAVYGFAFTGSGYLLGTMVGYVTK